MFDEQLVELLCTAHAIDEDHRLVEFERVHQIVELAVLLRFVQLDVILLQTVQRQFRLVVHENLGRLHRTKEHTEQREHTLAQTPERTRMQEQRCAKEERGISPRLEFKAHKNQEP